MGATVAATPTVESRARRHVPDDGKTVLTMSPRRRMEHPWASDFGDYKSSCFELMKQADNAPYTLKSSSIHLSFYRLKTPRMA